MQLTTKIVKMVFLGLTSWAAANSFVTAATMTYSEKDVVIGMRQTDALYEMVANLGPIGNLKALAPGTTTNFTAFNTNQIAAAFGTLDAVKWSVSACVYDSVGATPELPRSTIWTARPRTDINQQSSPWLRASTFTAAGAAKQIQAIGVNPSNFSGSQPEDPLRNTATAVMLPAGDRQGYGVVISDGGNLKGTFQGNIEQTMVLDESARSDFYELLPGSGDGNYLGYFELSLAGVLSFTAAGGSVSLPGLSIDDIAVGGDPKLNTAQFTVSLSSSATSEVSVSYASVDGTALADVNYQAVAGKLVFLAGSTNLTQNIVVPLMRRSNATNDTQFSINLSGAVNATLTKNEGKCALAKPVLPLLTPGRLGVERVAGSQVRISFPTELNATYAVRFTNHSGLRAQVSSWPLLTNGVAGTGSSWTLTDDRSEADRFYILQGAR